MSSQCYSLQQLAALARITERTLRYYDQIDLLKPASRNAQGHRVYGRNELDRLQQILLYRALDFDLATIQKILEDPGYDLLTSLEQQRKTVLSRQEQFEHLLGLIDKTIQAMQDKSKPLTDRELYQGLSIDSIDEMRNEAEARWGDEFKDAEQRARQMSKAEISALKKEGEDIVVNLSQMMRLQPDDAIVQSAIARYHEHLNKWNPTPKVRWKAMADMYVDDERFAAYYNKHAAGFANWLREAIQHFCEK